MGCAEIVNWKTYVDVAGSSTGSFSFVPLATSPPRNYVQDDRADTA